MAILSLFEFLEGVLSKIGRIFKGCHDILQEPMLEARRADVMERDGTVLVRKANGDWLFLRKSQSNPKAFVLEGEYGDKYLLQLDTKVSRLRLPLVLACKNPNLPPNLVCSLEGNEAVLLCDALKLLPVMSPLASAGQRTQHGCLADFLL